jgi:hypothetical protein
VLNIHGMVSNLWQRLAHACPELLIISRKSSLIAMLSCSEILISNRVRTLIFSRLLSIGPSVE